MRFKYLRTSFWLTNVIYKGNIFLSEWEYVSFLGFVDNMLYLFT
jgi:hypothetical protein